MKEYSPNLLKFVTEFLQREEEDIFVMKISHYKTYCSGYYAYLLKNIFNSSMDILLIWHMDRRNKMMTTKKYILQFQLTYICFSNLRMHEQMRNSVLGIHK